VGGGNDNSNSKTILVPTPAWSRFAMVSNLARDGRQFPMRFPVWLTVLININ
jgi:hypothetical protein